MKEMNLMIYILITMLAVWLTVAYVDNHTVASISAIIWTIAMSWVLINLID